MSNTRIGSENFGLFAIIESQRVVLPLKGVECEFAVRGGVVDVCMSQIFRQENPKALDCEYLFPLPADASVYFCEADINGRIIRAQIKELGEARRIVAGKKAEGLRTALVESVRDNLFTLALGNVQPDDLVIIRMKYFQTLRALGDLRSIEIPFCPGVRYIPGTTLLRSNRGKGIADDTNEVPDASRISPVRIDADHPDAAYMDVRGRLDAKYAKQSSVMSPSHAIEIAVSTEELCVTLATKGEVPNQDFVLRWDEAPADAIAPRAWTSEKQDEVYALLEVRAPKAVLEHRKPLDYYFLVDQSGSMKGLKWEKAIEALLSCLSVLRPDDRAMVTLFETSFRDFAERPLYVGELFEDRQFQQLRQLGTAGGTNLAPALKHVLEVAEKCSAGLDRNLILITDAQIGNDAAILDLMKSAPNLPVHCFGIDIALNDALLLALSRQQGGTFHSLNPKDDIAGLVTQLGKTLGQPVLLDLRLSEGWEGADTKIPNLYAGQFLYLSARGSAERPLELTARTPSGETTRFHFQSQPLNTQSPRLHWARTRIQRLLGEGKDREATALSVSNNLLCRLTAFVAWDETEKVVVARHELIQPSQQPESLAGGLQGFSMAKCSPSTDLGFVRKHGAVGHSEQSRRYALRPDPASKNADGAIKAPLPVTFHAPRQTIHDLHAACQKIGGNDWEPSYQMIANWFAQATDDKLRRHTEALKRLVQKIDLYCLLEVALMNGGFPPGSDWIKNLRIHQLEFRKLQQQWKAGADEFKELENLFQRIEATAGSVSVEQLSLLDGEIHRQIVGMIKSFADMLWNGQP